MRAHVPARGLSTLRQRIPSCGFRLIRHDCASGGLAIRDGSEQLAGDDHIPPSGLLWMQRSAMAAILPKGFPRSVSANYFNYVQWTALSLFTGRVQAVLATQAMLFAIGLGKGAVPMAAAIQWVLKDGIGHLGAIVYAASVNTRFDAEAKRYRFQATVALTFADFVAVAMPLVPQHFFVLASLSSATSSIANLAQVASRARVMSSFALQGNLADCTRAGQTQAKLMSILGTSAGAGLSWVIGPSPVHVGMAMLPLAAISLYSTYASCQLVVLRSLNLQRAERVFEHILRAHEPLAARAEGDSVLAALAAPNPEQVGRSETFGRAYTSLFSTPMELQPIIGTPLTGGWRLALPFARRIELGAVAQLVAGDAGARPHGWTAAWHAGGAYALACSPEYDRVAVWHREGSTSVEKLRAVWHASALRWELGRASRERRPADVVAAAHEGAHRAWPSVLGALTEAGWSVENVFLDGDGASLARLPADAATDGAGGPVSSA